jgi:hypothetical protein
MCSPDERVDVRLIHRQNRWAHFGLRQLQQVHLQVVILAQAASSQVAFEHSAQPQNLYLSLWFCQRKGF